MLKVLGRQSSGNVQKVLWLLEELGKDYERLDYGRQFNNTSDANYLSLNPNGKVPTLVDGKLAVWESNTILRYLANKFAATEVYPVDPAIRSQVERWMDWQLAAVNEPYLAIFKGTKLPAAERPDTWESYAKQLDTQLSILEGGLSNGGWIVGEKMTLTDFTLGPIVARCLDFPIELSNLPKLRSWCNRISSRPAFIKATGSQQ